MAIISGVGVSIEPTQLTTAFKLQAGHHSAGVRRILDTIRDKFCGKKTFTGSDQLNYFTNALAANKSVGSSKTSLCRRKMKDRTFDEAC